MHDDLQLGAKEKVVQKMTRDGLVEENLSKGTSRKVSARAESDDFSLKGEEPARTSSGLSSSPDKARKRRYAKELRDAEAKADGAEHPVEDAKRPLDETLEESMEADAEEAAVPAEAEAPKPKSRSRLAESSVRSEVRSHRDQKADVKHEQHKQRVYEEQAKKKPTKLKFDDEPVQPVKGEGVLHKAGAAGKSAVGKAGLAAETAAHAKVSEAEQDNSAVEAAHKSEMAAEGVVRKAGTKLSENSKAEKVHPRSRSSSLTHETERPASKLKFEQAEPESPVQKANFRKAQQKKRLKRQYAEGVMAARKSGETVSAASSAPRRSIKERISAGVKKITKNNKGALIAAAGGVLAVILLISTIGTVGSLFSGTTNAVAETTYLSSDDDIHAVENAYAAMEADLQTKINNVESDYPGYDEYQYQVDEITHNPYQLISYFTVKYGEFTYDQVKDELKDIFDEQYRMSTASDTRTETVTRTVRVGESLGSVVTSGYCSCSICCGQWAGGPTASGVYPTANHTIAVDAYNPFVPMGTHIIMNGTEYVVEDTGNFARYGVQFDVYYDDHNTALAHGHRTWEAYIADSNGSNTVEVTETKTIRRLSVTVANNNLDLILRNRMTTEQQQSYNLYNATYGNRDYLFPTNALPIVDGMSYEIPPEALSDTKFAAMIHEAEKYLGYPYVWGGSSPSTSFDCSGFVSWVVNHCGLGWDFGRLGADGLKNKCTYVSPADAKPGDLIFFQGTYDTTGASHVGIYVGNGMMLHCGNPIQYTSIETNYWQAHFLCFGRLPEDAPGTAASAGG